MSGYHGHNQPAPTGGPQPVQRSYASQLREQDTLFATYEHLQGLPRGDAALTMLRKVASMVKPIMRKRRWNVQILAEFLPFEANLLGLNINRGYKICVRLRYHNNPDLFLPIEQVIDTMLHELSHIIWGDHDGNFHRLWDELRDELEILIRKGYTGEGFLSEGKRLGGSSRAPPMQEMRRLARASAEKRRTQNKLTKGSGQRLGGTPLHRQGGDVRQIIADQATRRTTINKGCASGRQDAGKLSNDSANQTFKTKAEEDDANNRAIAQALYDLIEEEEEQKLKGTFSAAPTTGGLAWHPENGLYDPGKEGAQDGPKDCGWSTPSEEEQMEWALQSSLREMPPSAKPNSSSYSNDPSNAHSSTLTEAVVNPVSAISRLDSQTRFQERPGSPHRLSEPHIPRAKRRQFTATSSDSAQPASHRDDVNNRSIPRDFPIAIDLTEPFIPASSPTDQWTCNICTCINPVQFLACDACGIERPQRIGTGNRPSRKPVPRPSAAEHPAPTVRTQETMGWNCGRCGAFMEHKWWTCSACGVMKDSS